MLIVCFLIICFCFRTSSAVKRRVSIAARRLTNSAIVPLGSVAFTPIAVARTARLVLYNINLKLKPIFHTGGFWYGISTF